jgi:hypothetical protein
MSFMGKDFRPGLLHQGQLYWDNLMETRRVNIAQKARDLKDVAKHILYILFFTGETTRGVLVIDSTVQKYTWQGCLLSYVLIETLRQQCIICTIEHAIVFTEQRFMV